MKKMLLCLGALLCLAASASAQDLKPLKDKTTKKFGYIDSQKQWVIEPAFDKAEKFEQGCAIVSIGGKDGLINELGQLIIDPIYDNIEKFKKSSITRIMVKSPDGRLWGAADCTGRIILDAEHIDLDIDKTANLLYVRDLVEVPFAEKFAKFWGICRADGSQLFPPQFETQPYFGSQPTCVATDGATLLKGVIDINGNVVVPFDFLFLNNNFLGLNTQFQRVDLTPAGATISTLTYPAYIKPYDTQNDPVRLALYHWMGVAERLQCNQVMTIGGRGECLPLNVNWGETSERFARVEPVRCAKETKGALLCELTGAYYTFEMYLYEPDGTLVERIESGLVPYGDAPEATVYQTATGQLVALMRDPNAYTGTIIDTRNIARFSFGSIGSAIYSDTNRKEILSRWHESRKAAIDLLQQENTGITSYMPRPSAYASASQTRLARSRMFGREYVVNDVYGIEKGGQPGEYKITGMPLLRYKDEFPGIPFQIESCKPIWFGPRGNWFIRLVPEELHKGDVTSFDDYIIDDFDNPAAPERAFRIAVNLYDARGQYVRNLGVAKHFTFFSEDWIVLDELGIALCRRPGGAPARIGTPIMVLPPEDYKRSSSQDIERR